MSAVDNIEIQIEADAKQANSQLDKVIEKLGSLKNALSGVNTQKLKKEMQSFEDFQKQLQGLGQNVKVSGSIDGLKKQIEQAEAKLDALLKKENKLQTVGGIDQNSKSFRSLQYDIAEVCGQLDTLYAKMESLNLKKPLNFWEKPNWYENLQKYGTTDESAIDACVETGNSSDQIGSIKSVVEDLKSSLDEVGQAMNTAGQTAQNMGSKLQAVKGVFQQISEAFSGFREKLASRSGAEKFNSDMQSLIDGINQAKYTMKQMESGNIAFDSTAYERAARELAAASAQMQEYKNSLLGAAEQTSRLKAVLSGIGTVVKGAFAKLSSVGYGIMSACKTAVSSVKGLKASLPKLGAAFTGLGKKIKSVTRLFTFMVLRRAISALLSAMKEGFDNLARYSATKGTEFNKNLSLMKSSLKQLGNSFATIFEPIINVVTPILDVFLQKLISVTNAIAQFFAALTGKGTYTKAKKVVSDYAAELNGAAAAAKKLATATTGIDELNILSDNSANDSGSGLNCGGADAFRSVCQGHF